MKIVKLSYSRMPWRLVNEYGAEVHWRRPFEHPSLGWTSVHEPVGGDSKAACIDAVLAFLQHVVRTP